MNVSRSRRWAVAAAAFLVAVLLLTLLVGRGVRSVRLADGREVEIVAMTHGTNHTFVEGRFWPRLVQRFVSTPRALKLGVRVYRQSTATPALVVWTRWKLPTTNSVAPGNASVVDRHGFGTELSPAFLDATFARPGKAILAWQFANYPRPPSSCTLRFYDTSTPPLPPVQVAELILRPPNVGASDFPPALVAPMTRTNGSFEFSLLSLRTTEHPPSALSHRNFAARRTMAWFEVRQFGEPKTNWTIHNIEVAGATGNRFVLSRDDLKIEESNGRLGLAFTEVFWPDEPGWRMKVEFARSRDFPTNRLWTFRNLQAGLTNLPVTPNLHTDAHGITIQTLEVRRPNWTFAEPFRLGTYWRNANISLAYTPALSGVRMDLAQAVDNHGQELRFGHGRDRDPGRYLSGLELKTNTTHLDLTFVIHQTECVEFLVKPQFDPAPSPNAGK